MIQPSTDFRSTALAVAHEIVQSGAGQIHGDANFQLKMIGERAKMVRQVFEIITGDAPADSAIAVSDDAEVNR